MSLTQNEEAQRAELTANKERLEQERRALNAVDYVSKRLEGTPPEQVARLRESILKGRRLRNEQLSAKLDRINRDLSAFTRAEQKGETYAQARRVIKKKEALRDVSTEERLRILAERGDTGAQASLAAKSRFKRKAAFQTRVIPKFEKETIGKKSGVYISPLTGKPVIVREGGATSLPPSARAQFTDKKAKNLYTRDYTVFARVADVKTKKPETLEEPIKEPSQRSETNKLTEREQKFLQRAEAQKQRQKEFFESEGFKRIETLSTTHAYGFEQLFKKGETTQVGEFLGPTSLRQAGTQEFTFIAQPSTVVGKSTDLFLRGAFSPLLTIGGGLALTAEKAVISAPILFGSEPGDTVEVGNFLAPIQQGPTTQRQKDIQAEFKRSVEEVEKTSFSFLPGGTPINPEGYATLATAASFALLEGASAASLSKRSAAATEAQAGKVLSTEVIKDGQLTTQQKGLSVEIRADPVELIKQEVFTIEREGTKRSAGTQTVKYGETAYLTAKEIEKLPITFLSDANVKQITGTRPLSGSQEGLSIPSTSAEISGTLRGRTTAAEIQAATEPIIRFDVRQSDVKPGTVRQTISEAEIRFTPYDVPPTSAVTTTGGKTSARGKQGPAGVGIEKKGGSLGYEPKLDFFEEFTLSNQGTSVTVRESPYTGAREVITTPFIVKEVIFKPTKTRKAAETGVSTKNTGVVEVELPRSDGTVQVQKIKVDFEPAKQEAKQKQETKKKQEQEQENLQKQREKALSKQKKDFQLYTFKQSDGVPLSEAIVRFKGLQEASAKQKIRLTSILSPKSIQRNDLSVSSRQATSTDQTQDFASGQDVTISTSTAVDVGITTTPTQKYDLVRSTVTTTPVVRPPNRINPFERPKPKTPIEPTFDPKDKLKRDRGVDLLVRRRGAFKVIAKGLKFEEAIKRGATIVGTTAAASFKIEGEKRTGARGLNILGRQFRKSKKDPDIIVERSRFRISTPGEIAEITRKGQTSKKSRKKKLFGGAFKWAF